MHATVYLPGADAIAKPRRVSPARVAAALVVLGSIGMVLGALSGGLAGALGVALSGEPDWFSGLAQIGAFFGAILGTPLAPLLGFGPLRRVPLGRAIGSTVLATVVGGAVSFPLVDVWAPFVGAGCATVAAVLLWAQHVTAPAAASR